MSVSFEKTGIVRTSGDVIDDMTPWIQNVADHGFVPTDHGFFEEGNHMSIYENRIQTTEFIEW